MMPLAANGPRLEVNPSAAASRMRGWLEKDCRGVIDSEKRSIAEEYTSKLSNKREKACGRRNLREDSASRINDIPKKDLLNLLLRHIDDVSLETNDAASDDFD